jgi:hypothetical protein
MGFILTTLVQWLPSIVMSAVMVGVALFGWRRTRATGALLIAIGAAVSLVDDGVGIWQMSLLVSRQMSVTSTATLFAAVRMAGHVTSSVLFIVGVALLLQRLPQARPRATQSSEANQRRA